MQVNGLRLSACVASERHESDPLAVNLAVSLLSLVNAAPVGRQAIALM
jgi:hypothetical protein